MNGSDFTITFLVDQSPEQVFAAVTDVRGWWSEALEGSSSALDDEFTYKHKDIHSSRQKLVEVIPNEKVVWLVTDSYLSFLDQKNEWTGTTISFEISNEDDKTKLQFTHDGLTPEIECFDACSSGWNYYLQGSLLPLITTGQGKPDKSA